MTYRDIEDEIKVYRKKKSILRCRFWLLPNFFPFRNALWDKIMSLIRELLPVCFPGEPGRYSVVGHTA